MNFCPTIWRFIIFFSFSIKFWPLLPAETARIKGCAYLTVEPAPIFILGSNLTVYCNIEKCQQSAGISLELNHKRVAHWKQVNSNTTVFSLFNVTVPQSMVQCILQRGPKKKVFGGLDLNGGLPPDKPRNIICETPGSSDVINCMWKRGQETHLKTIYNISVSRENGTRILFDQVQDAGEIIIQRALIDENSKYQLNITAYNDFGETSPDPVFLRLKDMVIPDTPLITQMKFKNNPMAALLEWNTTESSEHLRSYVRLRTDDGSWTAGEATELGDRLIQVDGLKFLTEYEFQLTLCNPGPTHMSLVPRSATRERSYCSKWSPSVKGRSPGKGPSERLDVWRKLGSQQISGLREVIVLWKPPSPKDYSGEVLQYQVFVGGDQKQNKTCGAALSQCLIQVSEEVRALSISAVTSYGASPPADVPLRSSGEVGPVLRELLPVANGSVLLVSWSWQGNKQWLKFGEELLNFVLEWTSVPAMELQWQKVAKDDNRTSITGLLAGVRYNISVCAVTSRVVSVPSSRLIYSREKKPRLGPVMSVLAHEARRILIRWDEVPLIQQQGFITNYTIYLQKLHSSDSEISVTIPASDLRRAWLDCPEGALALEMTASNSAGEGPRGNRIASQSATSTSAVGLVAVIGFIFIIFIGIMANLLYSTCMKERIKKTCISLKPAWFWENLPKLGNSIAIRLLEQDGSEPTFTSNYSEPTLSPVSLISQEGKDDMYPDNHVEMSGVGSGQIVSEKPLLMSDPETTPVDRQLEHGGYKPQIGTLVPYKEEVMEDEVDQRDEEEDRGSAVFGGFLSTVGLDLPDSPLGLTLFSGSGAWWPKPTELMNVLDGGFNLGSRLAEDDVEAESPSLDTQQDEILTVGGSSIRLSQCIVGATQTHGYFPQAALVGFSTICDAQEQQG